MRITWGKGSAAPNKAPLMAVLVTEEGASGKKVAGFDAAVARPLVLGDFTGAADTSAVVYEARRRVVLVGLGKARDVDADRLRRAAATGSARARTAKLKSVALSVPDLTSKKGAGVDAADAARAVTEGLILGAYSYHGKKTDKAPPAITSATVFIDGGVRAVHRKGAKIGAAVARGQCLARDLGNHPGNVATPAFLASTATRIARNSSVRCKIVKGAELKKRGFGGLLGVAAGSAEPPAFIEMEHRPTKPKKTVCLVGKGLTFDTGGISLKPSASMEEMKFDMCGGAAVLGAMQAVAELQPKNVRVYGLVPTSSNMPDGNAIKPGDVLVSYGGISMEIINTDAEGRLILADALGRAQELKADYTIDVATLTGACVVALGHHATGLFTESDEFAERLTAAGAAEHERMWRLPVWDEYLDEMKSAVADVKNMGSRWGGASTAAAFLKKFAGDLNWTHLDIAGTAWDTPKNDTYRSGATGVGVRTLVRFIESLD